MTTADHSGVRRRGSSLAASASNLGDRVTSALFTSTEPDLEVKVEVHQDDASERLPVTRAQVLRTCEALIWGSMASPARDLWPARAFAKPKSRQPTLRLLPRVEV